MPLAEHVIPFIPVLKLYNHDNRSISKIFVEKLWMFIVELFHVYLITWCASHQ